MNGKRTYDRRPSITATGLWHASDGKRESLLTDEQSEQLALVSSVVRFKKGAHIYHEGDPADAVFNIVTGVVKSYKTLSDRTHHIVAFLFANDVVGLAEEGRYVNSAVAVTAVTGYKMPVAALKTKLGRESDLDFNIICKLCHELRETQRHGLLLSKHQAVAKVAMFLQMLEAYQADRNESTEHVYLPMIRSDIGDYVGISPEAVSRSFKALESRGVREARPHANSCLVIDLEMPGMSGLDLLETIRQAGVAVPAIITAERTDQRIQSAVAGAGATLLEKPYSPDELVLSIRKACDERAC